MSTFQAMQAQSMYEDTLLQKSNVVGVAVGFKESKGDTQGELAVVVLVEQKKPLAALSADDVIPRELEGMRTDVYEVGYLRANQVPNPRTAFRPIVPNGISVGHFKVTAGTLGTIVKDRVSGDRLLLSNNHVLANSNDAVIGDAILQPAAMDGGKMSDDTVATLARFVALRYVDDPVTEQPTPPVQPPPVLPPDPLPNPGGTKPPVTPGPTPSPTPAPAGGGCLAVVAGLINAITMLTGSSNRLTVASAASASATSPMPRPVSLGTMRSFASNAVPENLCDCALAKPLDPNMFSDDILGIGLVNETTAATLGMRVRKFGRTTQYTEGNITLLNATVNVSYNTVKGTRTARFVGQVITEAMSQGGDSGSLIVSVNENKAVGLLFAGSNLATIFTPIDVVLNALNITL